MASFNLALFVHTSKLAERVKVAIGVRRNFSRGWNVDILLIIFRLLTLQCKWTFTKSFPVSTAQRKSPMKACVPFASVLKSLSSGAVGCTSLPQRCTFGRLLQLLLNWSINVVIIVNSTQILTWTIGNYVSGSLICQCWLNRTHFWNLLSELFSTLRLSEMLFISCLISIFASTFYK